MNTENIKKILSDSLEWAKLEHITNTDNGILTCRIIEKCTISIHSEIGNEEHTFVFRVGGETKVTLVLKSARQIEWCVSAAIKEIYEFQGWNENHK